MLQTSGNEDESPASDANDEIISRDDDFDDDEDLEEIDSPALLLILSVGGFGLGTLLTGLSWTSAAALSDFAGEWAWILVPVPMLLFGLGSLSQYELPWLKRLGAAAIGLALSQFLMLAIGFSVLDI